MELTPYAGDPLKQLAAAAGRKTCGWGFITRSWTGIMRTTGRGGLGVSGKFKGGDNNRYVDYMKAQLRELLTQWRCGDDLV